MRSSSIRNIRTAANLPKGDPMRRTLLAKVQKTAVLSTDLIALGAAALENGDFTPKSRSSGSERSRVEDLINDILDACVKYCESSAQDMDWIPEFTNKKSMTKIDVFVKHWDRSIAGDLVGEVYYPSYVELEGSLEVEPTDIIPHLEDHKVPPALSNDHLLKNPVFWRKIATSLAAAIEDHGEWDIDATPTLDKDKDFPNQYTELDLELTNTDAEDGIEVGDVDVDVRIEPESTWLTWGVEAVPMSQGIRINAKGKIGLTLDSRSITATV